MEAFSVLVLMKESMTPQQHAGPILSLSLETQGVNTIIIISLAHSLLTIDYTLTCIIQKSAENRTY